MEGVSAARNAGIVIARGEFIGFVDGDDYIDTEMYEQLVGYAIEQNADIIYCEATFIHTNGTTSKDELPFLDKDKVFYKDEWTPELLKYIGSVDHALYNSSLIKNHHISFPENLIFSEDRVFNLYAFGYASRVLCVKKTLYNIVLHNDSCIQRFHEKHFEKAKEVKAETEKALKYVWENSEIFQTAFLSQYIDHVIAAIKGYDKSGYNIAARYCAICKICKDQELKNAIKITGYGGEYAELIAGRKVIYLLLWKSKLVRQVYYFIKKYKMRLHRYQTMGVSGLMRKIIEIFKR